MEVLVNTYRGPLQDMMHTGHIAVVDYTGKLLYSCGDPERVCYARSSAKPMQAMCVLESLSLIHILDTVFPIGTNPQPRKEGTRVYAPGIVDDTRGMVVPLSCLLYTSRCV